MHFFRQISLPYTQYYHRLPPSDEEDSLDDKRAAMYPQKLGRLGSQQPRWRSAILYAAIVVLTTSLAVMTALYVRQVQNSSPASLPLLTCGTTVAEAKAAGCSFDRLTKAWLPAQCSRKYEAQFLEYPVAHLNMTTGWQYYEDRSAEREVTDDDLARYAETKPMGQMAWASTGRMHLAHCAFVLMRRSDAEESGDRVDKTTEFSDHSRHCLSMLLRAAMNAPGIDEISAEGEVGFGAC